MMREITYSEAIREALCEEMRKNPDVFLIGEDIGVYGGAFGVTRGMIHEFGRERVMDTPISEAAIMGAAVGAALTGMRPVAEMMFSDFVTIAMDQLVNQGAKLRYMFGGKAKVPLVLRLPGGSGTGAAAQHSQSLEAWLCHVPGLKVVAPSTPYDAKGLVKAAIRDDNPVVVVESKLLYKTKGEVPEEEYELAIGTADIKREGSDASVITYGRMLSRALEASNVLAGNGISVEVLDLRTLYPLDKTAIIKTAMKTGRVLISHEAAKTGGIGGEVSAVIADSEAFFHLDAPIKRLCGLDTPIPYSPMLEKAVVPDVEAMINAIKLLVN